MNIYFAILMGHQIFHKNIRKLIVLFSLLFVTFADCDVKVLREILSWGRCIKDTLKAFYDFINEQQNRTVWSNVLWYIKVCVFWKCIQYTIHWAKTQILKKFLFEKNKRYKKMPSFFFRELQLITVLPLISDPYMSWSTRFVSLKLCVGFSVFDSVSFWLKFIFLFNKMHGLFDFKTS